MLNTLATLALVALAGCTEMRSYKGVTTAQNPEATRVWLIEYQDGRNQSVVLCDTAYLESRAKTLCVRWPAPEPK